MRVNVVYSSDEVDGDVGETRDVLEEDSGSSSRKVLCPPTSRRVVFDAPGQLGAGNNPSFFDALL